MSSGRKPLRLKGWFQTGSKSTKKVCSSPAKHVAVTMLVNCMLEVEAAQQRIGSHFGSAQNVATAIGLSLSEAQQFLHTPLVATPNPAMQRCQHPIESRGVDMARRRLHSNQPNIRVLLAGNVINLSTWCAIFGHQS